MPPLRHELLFQASLSHYHELSARLLLDCLATPNPDPARPADPRASPPAP